jgi:hypothetical protein
MRGRVIVGGKWLIVLGAFWSVLGASWAQAETPNGGLPQILGPAVYYGALSGGDWYFSHQASRGGYPEANPVIRKVGLAPAKAIGGVLMVGGDYALRKHKKTRWALRIGAGVGYGYLMVRASRKGR